MAAEELGLHEAARPSEYRKVSAIEREREWLAKQFSKERGTYWEKVTVSPMVLPDRLSGPLNNARVRGPASRKTCLG